MGIFIYSGASGMQDAQISISGAVFRGLCISLFGPHGPISLLFRPQTLQICNPTCPPYQKSPHPDQSASPRFNNAQKLIIGSIVEAPTHKSTPTSLLLLPFVFPSRLRLYSYRVISIVFTYYLHQQIRQHFNLG